MKKSKRSDGWEESPLVSSKSFDEEFSELDEEIIELDDEIIELPANGLEDHEEPTFDVEILDADRQLDLKEGAGRMESEEEFLLEEDLLKELPFFQDQPTEEASAKTAAKVPSEPESLKAAPELFSDTGEVPPEAPASPEPLAEAPVPAAFGQAAETSLEPEPSLEDFMVQLESRLLDAVRELVEARLPEIVRTVLKEEIERLKSGGEMEA